MLTLLWLSQGAGPLQYISLAIFVLQLVPQFISVSEDSSSSFATFVSLCRYVPLIVGMSMPLVAGYHNFRHLLREIHNNTNDNGTPENNEAPTTTRFRSYSSLFLFVPVAAIALLFSWASILFTDGTNQLLLIFVHIFVLTVFMAIFLKDLLIAIHGDSSTSSDNKLSNIVEMVRVLPMEEFVTENEVRTTCSIPQLKRMLTRRGVTSDQCLERSELVQKLETCRNYNDTCCICAEEYQDGDSLRILPKCRHEFHVECMDQWAFTFASNKGGRGHQSSAPSCPLCKTPLK